MGKASRWFRSLLGMKKDKDNMENFSNSVEKKDKKRWSFAKSEKGCAQIPGNAPVMIDSSWLRYGSETEKEQNKHAIAVAAATAAAADAAVAAAQAAVAVVRLTSHGRGAAMFSNSREKSAAIKIQMVFRGYLARKALRALKGLVKLQALVRGFLVRKRAAATLHSMQALFRAQANIRSQRARRSMTKCASEMRARKSIERFDETRSEYHSKRLSASYDQAFNEESPKIVEIDTYKTRSRSRRINTSSSEYSDEQHYQPNSSPFPIPTRISVPDYHRHTQDFDWSFLADDCKFATANSTPRFVSSGRSNGPVTPAKSVCGDAYYRPYSNHPSYMANTQSFRAKLRSHSAPRQRPADFSGPGPKKRLSLNEIMASRSSFSGVRMQRACSHVEEDEEEY